MSKISWDFKILSLTKDEINKNPCKKNFLETVNINSEQINETEFKFIYF